MTIISISGKMGSGKNTVAAIIQYLTHCKNDGTTFEEWCTLKNYSMCTWKQVAFAAKLKQIVSILTGIPVEDLEDEKVKSLTLEEAANLGIISKEFLKEIIKEK